MTTIVTHRVDYNNKIILKKYLLEQQNEVKVNKVENFNWIL
mgnify:CR=1 FL=1